jgi:hypothetical protein
MTIKLQSTANITSNQGVKLIIYGGAGAGKTVLCSTAPRPVILSAEAGLLSLRKFQLPYILINDYKSLEEAYTWVMKSNESKQFDTICLDSLSEIAEVVLVDLKLKHKDPRKAYGEVQDQILALIRDFRDMPQKHVYFSAKQEKVKDEATGAFLYGPMMPGTKLPQQVPYFFDEVLQLFVYTDPTTKEEIRALRTKKDFQYEAKDRSGTLDIWEPANLEHVFNKIIKG